MGGLEKGQKTSISRRWATGVLFARLIQNGGNWFGGYLREFRVFSIGGEYCVANLFGMFDSWVTFLRWNNFILIFRTKWIYQLINLFIWSIFFFFSMIDFEGNAEFFIELVTEIMDFLGDIIINANGLAIFFLNHSLNKQLLQKKYCRFNIQN